MSAPGFVPRLDAADPACRPHLARLAGRAGEVDPAVERTVREIVEAVRAEGDAALIRFTRELDGVDLEREGLWIEEARLEQAASRLDAATRAALEEAASRIRAFHEGQMARLGLGGAPTPPEALPEGIYVDSRTTPLARVGCYVPGGTAAYPSSVLMNLLPARVAGVEELVVAMPTPRGEVSDAALAAMRLAGVRRVLRAGGAQAVAALAYGTGSVPRVDKIVGPGNIYVATAKRLLFGEVDIDMVAGPSEILVVADDTARPDFVAADLLSQAEHDPLASAVLLTPSRRLADAVEAELARQLARLPRRDIAARSLAAFGALVVTRDLDEAVELANALAPEHCELAVADPAALAPRIRNAGALFLGHWATEALGDYCAGPSHVLPTGGTARFFSPLSVETFLKRTSLIACSPEGARRLAPTAIRLAEVEGLEGHAEAVRLRQRALEAGG
ncbi:MAG TPA: histidinol dehydrogenase [Thermodesulfobacteriota bacterium]